MSEIVGRVAALWRFPVKSMAGESLAEAELGWRGIHGDRQYGFLQAGNLGQFPWFTARDLNDLIRYQARFRDCADTRKSEVDVIAPDGATFALDAPELSARLAETAGMPVELLQSGRGVFDAMPVSIVTTATLAAIDRAHGEPLDLRRFRINIVIESDLREDGWGERLMAFGDGEAAPRLILHEPIERCVMITIDPDSARRSPGVMRTVVQQFDNRIGMYASAARTGVVRVGDAVRLL